MNTQAQRANTSANVGSGRGRVCGVGVRYGAGASLPYDTTPLPPVPLGGRSSWGRKYFCTLLKAYLADPTFFSALARRTPWRRMRSAT